MTQADLLVREFLAHGEPRHTFSAEQREALKARIRELLRRENAVLVAHYYTDPLLQELAEETGGCVSDSLEMARFGASSKVTSRLQLFTVTGSACAIPVTESTSANDMSCDHFVICFKVFLLLADRWKMKTGGRHPESDGCGR